MYLAIDGGGTKTEYLLLDQEFKTVGRHLGGCINHDFLEGGWDGTKRELLNGVRTLTGNNGAHISDIKDAAAGLAGIDNGRDQEEIEGIFREIGFREFTACNDGFLTVWGECPGGVGIAYNCGTAVCCAGIDESGRMEKTAGFDEWSGDAGGGNWIVQNVFRLAYRSLVLHRKETAFAAAYRRRFSLKTEADFLNSWSMLKDAGGYPDMRKDAIALFFEQLEAGEEGAAELAEQMALCGAENIRALTERLVFSESPVSVVLTGSIHTKAANRTYLALLERRIRERIALPFTMTMASGTPAEGAARHIRGKWEGSARRPGMFG